MREVKRSAPTQCKRGHVGAYFVNASLRWECKACKKLLYKKWRKA